MINLGERIINGLSSRYRNAYYRGRGVQLQGYSLLKEIEIPRNFQEIAIHSGCALERGVTLLCSGAVTGELKIIIGSQSYINRFSLIDATLSVRIGTECAVGPSCYITDHDHGLDPTLAPLAQDFSSQPTAIGNRVWIGANVTVLKGVSIGDDAVIGAGSVVTKNIPTLAIAVGNPARVIRLKS